MRAEPAPDCVLQEFIENSCIYACRYWMNEVQRDELNDSAVRSAIWYALQRAGMEIPVPSRNVTIDREQRGSPAA